MPTYSPQTLVARLRRRGALGSEDAALEAALLALPRERFLPGVPLKQVYADQSVPFLGGASGQPEIASTQPSITARMLRQLRLMPGQNVLQLGAGSGYTAALIAHIVGDNGRITAVEIDPATTASALDNLQHTQMGRVLVVNGDAAQGYAPRANYDRILVNAAVWDLPRNWVQQLKPDGVLVAPLWLGALQYSVAFRPSADGSLMSEDLTPTDFVPLRGNAAGPRTQMRVGGSSLLLTGDTSAIDSAALHTLMSEAGEIDYLSTPLSGKARKKNFLPYLMLHLPPEVTFCLFSFEGDQLPYGMERAGFAVLGRGSVAFVSLAGDFRSFIFGGADAFIAAHEAFSAWRAAGMPGDEQLRVKLTAKNAPQPEADAASPSGVRVSQRADHDVAIWLG
jgi:protein-L-isoaspartate(D-aspartate) O-methyltransferase